MPFVLDRLEAMYGRPHWEPRPDPVGQLVVTILSQHTSDANADRAFAALQARYPTWAAVEDAPLDELTDTISVGDYGSRSLQRSTRRVSVMPPERIRTLPFGTGLVLLRSAPPIVANLRQWTDR